MDNLNIGVVSIPQQTIADVAEIIPISRGLLMTLTNSIRQLAERVEALERRPISGEGGSDGTRTQ